MPLAFPTVNRFCTARLYGHAGRSTAQNGGFRHGQGMGDAATAFEAACSAEAVDTYRGDAAAATQVPTASVRRRREESSACGGSDAGVFDFQ